MADTWTAELVAERLSQAAGTLARSRAVGVGPSGMRAAWPSVIHDRNEAYGYTAAVAPRIEPSAAELSALDRVLGWVSSYLTTQACERARLPADAGWVAWERARGMTLARISTMRARQHKGARPPGGNSRETVRHIADGACAHVAACLRRDRVPLHVGSADAIPEPPSVLTGRSETLPRVMDARPTVLNARPCGECKHIRAMKGDRWRCAEGGGEVVPSMPARAPVGAPCFAAKAGA